MSIEGAKALPVVSGDGPWSVAVAAPVLSQGDLLGCVLFAQPDSAPADELEFKLAETVAGFLGGQMEA